MEGIIGIILLIGFIMAGMPIGFAMAVSGCIGLGLAGGLDAIISVLSTSPFRTTASFVMTTLPMFILMAEIASSGGLAGDLFELGRRWIGHIPGGLGIATTLASAGFGAMSGSANACAATMSRIAIPEMLKVGYHKRLASAVVAIAGTLDPMIPPSILMVIYGITTETEIGKLLIAGIIPGIITAILYCVGIVIWVKVKPEMAKSIPKSTWKERFETLKGLGPLMILVVLVIGGMFFGVVTPAEAAALGALGALVICLVMGRLTRRDILLAFQNTVRTTAMIFMIVIGAMIFGYYLALVQATQSAIGFIGGLPYPPWVILILVVISYIIMGALFDELAMLLITLPLTFPLITNLGYDPIWFGVIIIALCEVGLVAPPVGMTAFVVSAVSKIPLDEVYKGTLVMLIWEFVAMLLFILFPEIVLFLPNLMFR